MEHATIPDPPGFAQLSKAEQVRYLQELWDRIAQKPGELPVPESHLELAETRLAEHRRDPSRAGSAYDVIDRLAERAKKPR
jgi:putative addiction module component (TIGR02574 family)